jgi:hypothetical protein
MRILVGFEESQTITKALRKLGHQAYSCDLKPASGGYPSWHLEGDIFEFLSRNWDMAILHPPCTYLSSSGLHWNGRIEGRQFKTDYAVAFVEQLRIRSKHIPKVAIENPIGRLSTAWRKPDQIIQPYNFGDDASKATCLWLKELPLLEETEWIAPREVDGKARWANQTDSGQNRLGPSARRAEIRSRTYDGIANAIAEQWTKEL